MLLLSPGRARMILVSSVEAPLEELKVDVPIGNKEGVECDCSAWDWRVRMLLTLLVGMLAATAGRLAAAEETVVLADEGLSSALLPAVEEPLLLVLRLIDKWRRMISGSASEDAPAIR